MYVPVIFEQLMNNPGPLKLGGLAVGDPCLGLDVFCGPGLFKVTFMRWTCSHCGCCDACDGRFAVII